MAAYGKVKCGLTVLYCVLCLCVDFQELFPDRDFNQDEVSVITISQKTNSDMIAWSVDMEEEREELMEHVSGSVGEEGKAHVSGRERTKGRDACDGKEE